VSRLLGYREQPGPVNRSMAEQMAADLLSGPILQDGMVAAGRRDWLVVQIAPGGKHWHCVRPEAYPTFQFINRRTGRFRLARSQPLSTTELAELR
jgi:hypothetical protein